MADRHTFFEALAYLAECGDAATLAYILGDAELIRIDATTGERPSNPPNSVRSRGGRSFLSADTDNGGMHIVE